MANILFTGVTESPLNYNQTLDYDKFVNPLELGVRNELIYSKGSDVVFMTFHVIFKHEKDEILKYSVRLNFQVEGWVKIVENLSANEIKLLPEVHELVEVTSGFLRGSMYVRAQNTPVKKLVLPILNIGDLKSHLVIIQSEK